MVVESLTPIISLLKVRYGRHRGINPNASGPSPTSPSKGSSEDSTQIPGSRDLPGAELICIDFEIDAPNDDAFGYGSWHNRPTSGKQYKPVCK
jgi:hypothetical protein